MKIKKRGGDLQDFDRMKIYHSVLAAGAFQEEANAIADQVQSWARGLEENTLSTMEIKEKIIELLGKSNPVAAQNYQNYRK